MFEILLDECNLYHCLISYLTHAIIPIRRRLRIYCTQCISDEVPHNESAKKIVVDEPAEIYSIIYVL